jgi:dihydroorotase
VARDLIVAEATGAHLHVAHVSTARAVEMVRVAKRRGTLVTAEVTPHHFTLSDQAVLDHGTNAKMNPPLRSPKDMDALLDGLTDGTVDLIASDHAPHAPELKQRAMEQAPFGVIGLETALGLALTQLVYSGKISLAKLVLLMSSNPASVVDKPLGRLRVGNAADITIFDPDAEWTYRVAEGHSRSRNTPFDGYEFRGAVAATVVTGKIVFCRG